MSALADDINESFVALAHVVKQGRKFDAGKHPRDRRGEFRKGMHVQLKGRGPVGVVKKVGQLVHTVDFGRGPERYPESDLTPARKLKESIDLLVEDFHGMFDEKLHPRGRTGEWVHSLHVPGTQMQIGVTNRPEHPSDSGHGAGRASSPGFVEGDRVVLPDGREGTVSGASHARGGEQHYHVNTEAGAVGSKAWMDEEIFHGGKYVSRRTALANVKKEARERYKGISDPDSAVQHEVDKFMGDWWNQDRPGRVEKKTVAHSDLRYSDDEMAARLERAQGIAGKAEKISGTKISTPAGASRPVTLSPHIVPNEWKVEHGYAEAPSRMVGFSSSRLKPGVNEDEMVFHYLTGRRPPKNPPVGSQAWEQWTYGMGGVKGGTKRPGSKADREAMIRKITQALAARDGGERELYEALLVDVYDLRSIIESGGATFDPLWVEEASSAAIHFDPGLHPRDRKGEFANVLGRLAKHVEVTVPGGITVKRGKIGGFKIEGRGGSSFHRDPEGTAQRALAMHDLTVPKPSFYQPMTQGEADRLGLFSPGGNREVAQQRRSEISDRSELDAMRRLDPSAANRHGLEGPFNYASGWSGMYDPKVGRYYDHKTDVYMPRDFDPHTGVGATGRMREAVESFVVEIEACLAS